MCYSFRRQRFLLLGTSALNDISCVHFRQRCHSGILTFYWFLIINDSRVSWTLKEPAQTKNLSWISWCANISPELNKSWKNVFTNLIQFWLNINTLNQILRSFLVFFKPLAIIASIIPVRMTSFIHKSRCNWIFLWISFASFFFQKYLKTIVCSIRSTN